MFYRWAILEWFDSVIFCLLCLSMLATLCFHINTRQCTCLWRNRIICHISIANNKLFNWNITSFHIANDKETILLIFSHSIEMSARMCSRRALFWRVMWGKMVDFYCYLLNTTNTYRIDYSHLHSSFPVTHPSIIKETAYPQCICSIFNRKFSTIVDFSTFTMLIICTIDDW